MKSLHPANLAEAACLILSTPEAADKVALTRQFTDAWEVGDLTQIGNATLPDRPARPIRPDLRPPREVPRRRLGSPEGRAAFIHAIAHIELNAIDLAWDILARFTYEDLPKAFFDDWCAVARDEAEHFAMLDTRLNEMGAAYGDMPAHDGLWQAARDTVDDLLARLALVPMVLEARGLDTAPDAVERLKDAGDLASAAILDHIGSEEIPHVAAGVRWFEYLCDRRNLDSVPAFHALVQDRFKGLIKAPFNIPARREANMADDYYQPLAA